MVKEVANKRDYLMQCDKCKESMGVGEERELYGQVLCEDCYIDILSPAKACDPWAVYGAKSFSKANKATVELTETQANILQILKDTGGLESVTIIERLKIKPSDLERDVATLRHMEKLRGELRDGKKFLCLW